MFYKLLSIEASYTRYSDAVIKNIFQLSSSEPTLFGGYEIIGTNARIEQQSLDLNAKVFVPIFDLFDLYGMIGMSYLDTNLPTKVSYTEVPGGSVESAIVSQLKLTKVHNFNYEMMYGFGAGYSFDDRFIFGLSYQQVQPASKKINKSSLFAFDLVFSFA